MTGFLLVPSGMEWYDSAVNSNSDIHNGLVVAMIGASLIIYVVFQNINRTSLVVGLIGSIGQLVLFSVATYIGFWLLLLWVFLQIVIHMGS